MTRSFHLQRMALLIGSYFAVVVLDLALCSGMLTPVPEDVKWSMVLLFFASPLSLLVGYLWWLRGPTIPVPDGPPLRSGSLLGRAWFEFADDPEHRIWLLGRARIDAIRQRPVPPLHPDGPVWTVTRTLWRPAQHTRAFLANGAAVGATLLLVIASSLAILGVFVGSVWWSGSLSSSFDLAELFSYAGGVASFWSAIGLGVLFGYTVTFMAGWSLWSLFEVRRTSKQLTIDGTTLTCDGRTLQLRDGPLTTSMSWDVFGAVLTVANLRQQVVVRGEHLNLRQLQDHLGSLPDSGDPSLVDARLRALQAVSS